MYWSEGLQGFDFNLVFEPEEKPAALRYGLSIAAVAASVLLALGVQLLGLRAPFLFFFPAVIFAAWYGGLGPGLFAAVSSSLGASFLFSFGLHARFRIDPASIALAVLFATMFGGLSVITSLARKNLSLIFDAVSLFLEGSADSVIVRDAANKIVYWNSGAAALYGWKRQEALGRNFLELLRPQLPIPLPEVEGELNRFGRWYGEVTKYRKDGSPVVVETAWRVKGDTSKRRLILQTDVPVTVKRMAEHSFRTSKIPERQTAEAAGIGFWDWDLHNDRLLCSENGIRMYGLPAGQAMTYSSLLGAVHPLDRKAIDGAVRDALKNRTDYSMEYRVIWPDGSIHWIAAAGRGLYRDESTSAEFMCGVFQDLTKHKEYAATLKQSSERFESVIETAEMGEWELDTETHSALCSPRYAQILGDEGIDSDWSYEKFLDRIVEEDRPDVDGKVQAAIEARSPWELQTRIRRKDGEVRWIWVRGQPWMKDIGKAHRILGTVLDITEQKNRELELQKANRSLVEAYSVAKMWPWKVDVGTEIVHYDMKLMSPFDSASKTEVPLSYVAGRTHPDDRESYLLRIHQACENDTPFEGEFRRLHPDGRYHWLLIRGRAMREGEKCVVVGISIDIDEFRRLQEESEKNRQLLEKFIEHAPAGLVMLDRNLRNVQASAQFCGAFGIDRKAMLGKDHFEVFPDLPEHFKEAYKRGLSGDHLIFFEEKIKWPDGKEHWVRVEIVPWGDVGKETGGIIIFSEDITAQHHAEAELKRLNRTLSALSKSNKALISTESEQELLETVVDTVAKQGGYQVAWVGVPENDEAKTVRIVARAGTDVDYLEGANITWDENVPSGCGPTGICLRTGSIVNVRIDDPMCAPWRERARSIRVAACLGLPLITGGKTLGALVLYSKDDASFDDAEVELLKELAGDLAFGIAMMRAREDAKRETKQRLLLEEQFRQSQKMEAVGQLAGGVAHDFNNMLMVIMSQAEMLLELLHDEDSNSRLRDIVDAADHCADLTRQLLAFSRKQVLQPTVVSLNTVVRDTTRLLKNAIREDIEVQFSLADDLRPVKIDRTQMLQVIMNLVINARDAMPKGGRLVLETYNRDVDADYADTRPAILPGRYAVLAISDTGSGMDALTQASVFEPFFTTKGLGQGTGMGLSTVYGIVKQSGGFIWLYSEVGKGTCFKVYLPWAEAELAQAPVKKERQLAKQSTAVILLVEDDPGLRRVINGFLSGAGYHVIAAESVATATDLAVGSSGQIDVLLTDVILAGGNGRELADSLREKGFNCRVVFMSGYTADVITHHGVLEPGIHFLQKPFTRTVLLEMIEKVLG